MLVDNIGDVTITNDGATILSLLDVQHPAVGRQITLSIVSASQANHSLSPTGPYSRIPCRTTRQRDWRRNYLGRPHRFCPSSTRQRTDPKQNSPYHGRHGLPIGLQRGLSVHGGAIEHEGG
jgi:hypothetical protein